MNYGMEKEDKVILAVIICIIAAVYWFAEYNSMYKYQPTTVIECITTSSGHRVCGEPTP